MDAMVTVDYMNKEEGSSRNLLDILEVDNVVEAKKKDGGGGVEPVTIVAAKETTALGPITPLLYDSLSPLDLASPPPTLVRLDHHVCGNDDLDGAHSSPRTPKEGVFDPFAPGPDDMVLAPHCKKYLVESRMSIARRLNFDSHTYSSIEEENRGSDLDSPSDEAMLFESVYGSLLEAIVSKQTESVLAETSSSESDSDGFKTPTSAPRLNGVAETCPGAPTKPTRKSCNIDQGLCRKLEF